MTRSYSAADTASTSPWVSISPRWSTPFACGLVLTGCVERDLPISSRSLSGSSPSSLVFVNEIHYDNEGNDRDEGIEVAGPAGTDLSSFQLVLYNGSNGKVYDRIALSGNLSDEGEGYGASAVKLPRDGLQNGGPDGIALVEDDRVLSFLSYEGSFVATEGPALGQVSSDILVAESEDSPVGSSLQRTGSQQQGEESVWVQGNPASFGLLNDGQRLRGEGGSPSTDGSSRTKACGQPHTPIGHIQGPEEASPFENELLEVEGTVVGVLRSSKESSQGFFLQASTDDGDPKTSDGVFIDSKHMKSQVREGDLVRVLGRVNETYGMTAIVAETITKCGTKALPPAVQLPLPYDHVGQLEALEGMLVTAKNVTVTGVDDLSRYGEVELSSGGRLFAPTNASATSAEENERRRILLDDGSIEGKPDPVPYLADDGTLRVGDIADEITGVLHFAFGRYRIQPLEVATIRFARNNARSGKPEAIGGNLRIATFNLRNYFTTLKQRGADTPDELERQRSKLVHAILGLDAHVLGLVEIENHPLDGAIPQALDDLVRALNRAEGAEIYAPLPTTSVSGGATRAAILYRPALLDVLPLELALEHDAEHRSPTAGTFSFLGDPFAVVVHHFKSKAGCPSDPADENADHGQGCWNAVRTRQAEALLNVVSQVQRVTDESKVVVLGDLNAYLEEDPLRILAEGGLINWLRTVPKEERYSHVYQGQSGLLDYALSTSGVSTTGVTIWHINADEPPLLDYDMEYNPNGAFRSDAFRSSDHDPVLLGISLTPHPGLLMERLLDEVTGIFGEPLVRTGVAPLFTLLRQAKRTIESATRSNPLDPAFASVRKRVAREQLQQVVDCLQSGDIRELVRPAQVLLLEKLARRVIWSLE